MRLTDRALLHPAFRARLETLDERLIAENIPLQIFEGPRTPWRQAELYARGRSIPNTATVTRAKAWSSYHQFGLAADYVFRIDAKWTWSEPVSGQWKRYQELAKGLGLDVLSFETPHVQYPWPMRDLQRGIYPPDGDAGWYTWLSDQIEKWGSGFSRVHGGIEHPGAPPAMDIDVRPAEVA